MSEVTKSKDISDYLYILAITGVITALLFSKTTSVTLLITEINSILVVDGILIPFIPILFGYLQRSFEYFKGRVEKIAIQLEAFLAVSLICAIFATGFSNIFSTALPFTILKLNLLQDLYIIDLSIAIAFLIAALVSIIRISFKVVNYVDLSFLSKVKDFALGCFTYLPIIASEDTQKPQALVDLLKSPVRYFDKDALKSSINSILSYDKTMPKAQRDKIDIVINNFLETFPTAAESVISKYLTVYDKLYNSCKQALGDGSDEGQITLLVRGLINAILGYDKYYYPNLYTKIVNTGNLNRVYSELQRDSAGYTEVKEYKAAVDQIRTLRTELTKQYDDLILAQI